MDPHVTKTLAALRKTRKALAEAYEAQLREIDATIEGVLRYGAKGSDGLVAMESPHAPSATELEEGRRRGEATSKPKRLRAPRGQIQQLMREAFTSQPGRFSVHEVRAFLDGRYPEESRGISAHRLSNEMHIAAKKRWIKLVSREKGGRNSYMKDKLPPTKE